MSAHDQDAERLRRLISGHEPEGLDQFLTVPDAGRLMFEGTSVPILGAHGLTTRGEFVLPKGTLQHTEPTAAYLILTDYLILEDEGIKVDIDAMIEMLAGDHSAARSSPSCHS